jgi:hypothetical protein
VQDGEWCVDEVGGFFLVEVVRVVCWLWLFVGLGLFESVGVLHFLDLGVWRCGIFLLCMGWCC